MLSVSKPNKENIIYTIETEIKSKIISTIIVYGNPHPISYIYQDLSNTQCLPKDKM